MESARCRRRTESGGEPQGAPGVVSEEVPLRHLRGDNQNQFSKQPPVLKHLILFIKSQLLELGRLQEKILVIKKKKCVRYLLQQRKTHAL